MKETSLSTRSLAVYLRFDEAINFKREGKKGRGEEGQIKRLAAYLIFLNQRGHILWLWWEKISTSFQRMTNSFLSWREIVERGNVFHRDKKERNGRFCSVSSSRSPVADRRRWGGHYHKPRSFGVGEFMKIELNCSAPSRKRQ